MVEEWLFWDNQTFWLEWSQSAAWTTVHTITGFASILIMFAHLWTNRTRITQLLGR